MSREQWKLVADLVGAVGNLFWSLVVLGVLAYLIVAAASGDLTVTAHLR